MVNVVVFARELSETGLRSAVHRRWPESHSVADQAAAGDLYVLYKWVNGNQLRTVSGPNGHLHLQPVNPKGQGDAGRRRRRLSD